MWPFLTGCHQGINRNFMHYASVHACHWKSCYNFRLLIGMKMMLFLIDQRFKQAVFQFSSGSILLATSLYEPLLMKNKCKMASRMKKISLFGDNSITKGYSVTKFFQCSLFIKAFLLVVFP